MHPADPGGRIIANSVVFTVATLERQIGLRRVKMLLAPTSSPRFPASRPEEGHSLPAAAAGAIQVRRGGGGAGNKRGNLQVFNGAHTNTHTQ